MGYVYSGLPKLEFLSCTSLTRPFVKMSRKIFLIASAILVLFYFCGFDIAQSLLAHPNGHYNGGRFSVHRRQPLKINSSNPLENSSITILVVLSGKSTEDAYIDAIDSLTCYSAIHEYSFLLVYDRHFATECPQKNKFFIRHCITAHILNKTEYVLFLDADNGVLNPRRKIEEFLDDSNLVFYDRFFNHEIMTGSYIARNTHWTKEFLLEFANYENHLTGFHGHDNGAIHAFLAKKLFPEQTAEIKTCEKAYNKSRNYEDLFAAEACFRRIMGNFDQKDGVKILKKGKAWARDNFLTNSKWSKERDFMFHGLKTKQLRKYNQQDLPLSLEQKTDNEWFNFLTRPLVPSDCTPGHFDWPYDENLIASSIEIEERLHELKESIEFNRNRSLEHLETLLKRSDFNVPDALFNKWCLFILLFGIICVYLYGSSNCIIVR